MTDASCFQPASPNVIRERRDTKTNNTVIPRLRLIAVAIFLVACGGNGNKPTNTYARGTDVQGQCCQKLAPGARDSCLSQVIRIDDAQIANTSVNQATYACVVEHFECDAATGRPTQQSAQAQLECIQDLEQ
jgi:hypothetical protein